MPHFNKLLPVRKLLCQTKRSFLFCQTKCTPSLCQSKRTLPFFSMCVKFFKLHLLGKFANPPQKKKTDTCK